jgi:hypothetical protein
VSLLPSLTRRPRLGLKLTRASMEMPASADRSGEPQYLAEGSSHLSRDRFVCVVRVSDVAELFDRDLHHTASADCSTLAFSLT